MSALDLFRPVRYCDISAPEDGRTPRQGRFRNRTTVLLITLVTLALCAEAGAAPGPDAFGYTVQATSHFSFLQITNPGSARVLAFDDDASYTANIGFVFNFYGVNFSTLSFSPNGLITFGGPSTDFFNVD